MARVVCTGLTVLDRILVVDRFPAGAGKHFAHATLEDMGGTAAIAAVTVARLGGDAVLVTRIGADGGGRTLAAMLDADGVDRAAVTVRDDAPTPWSAVLVDAAGERLIVNHRGPTLFAGDDDLDVGILDGAAALHCDLHWPRRATALARTARDRGIPVVLDYDESRDRTGPELLEHTTHAAFSAHGLRTLTGTDDPEAGLRAARGRTDAELCVTLGEAGVMWLDGGEVRRHRAFGPADGIDVVDTLGAGDVFHGALALALGEGCALPAAYRFASAAAALKCTRRGARNGVPDRDSVAALLRRG